MAGGRGVQSVDRPEFRFESEDRMRTGSPYVRFGDELAFHIVGASQATGSIQPRVDGSFWTVNYADLMKPR